MSLKALLGIVPALGLIPRLSDHDLLAQSRKPMDMIFHGWSMSLFQAPQQWSRMSSKDRKILFESQLSRMNCQTFSCGFNSGHLAGSGMSVILSGTFKRAERCHPA
jgi:hypothetical protein